MGVEKTPKCFDGYSCKALKMLEDRIYKYKVVQNNIAPASYWRDRTSSASFAKYLKESDFLAPLNNEVKHAKNE